MSPHSASLKTLLLLATLTCAAQAQETPGTGDGPINHTPTHTPTQKSVQSNQPEAPIPTPQLPPSAQYDPAIFQTRIPPADLAFLLQYDGVPTAQLLHDKQFNRLKKQIIPGVIFRYGNDKPLDTAWDEVLKDSTIPIEVRDNRYIFLAGHSGTYLAGRGFLWIDIKEGIALGGFFFHPTNGEPTPSVTIFSRQIKEDAISLGELPPAFTGDLYNWTTHAAIPDVTTRYFIGDTHEKILLEHDEDLCRIQDSLNLHGDCLEQTADAADLDMTAAYYLDQVHYATNATAYMLRNPDEVAFIDLRTRRCGSIADPIACRIRLTREQIHTIGRRPTRFPHR